MKRLFPLFLISIGVLFYSCQKENIDIEEHAISSEVLEKIASLGLNTNDVRFETKTRPDGSIDQCYIVEDYQFSLEQLNEMLLPKKNTTKHYRTYNLVNAPRVIKVLGFARTNNNNYDEYSLTQKMRTGLQMAIENYNQLKLEITFQLHFGYKTGNYDIVVYKKDTTAAGGNAGFPSGGKPYKWVELYSDLANLSVNVHEWVATHEIGHCIGLRHTTDPDGAVHIPRSPYGHVSGSIMNPAFVTNTNGEFIIDDKLALYYLYKYDYWLFYYRHNRLPR